MNVFISWYCKGLLVSFNTKQVKSKVGLIFWVYHLTWSILFNFIMYCKSWPNNSNYFNLKQLKDKYFLASEVTTLLNKITPSGWNPCNKFSLGSLESLEN